MSHEEQRPVGLGISIAADDINEEQNNTDTDTEHMQADEEHDGITYDQQADADIAGEPEDERYSGVLDGDTSSHFSSSSSEDEDEGDESDANSIDPLDASTNDPAHDQPESRISDADAEARARYGRPPKEAFWTSITEAMDWKQDDFSFHNWHKRQPWGISQEKYWKKKNGRLTALFPRGPHGQAVGEFARPGTPSALRRARSVNDLSPVASPTERSPASPIDGSQDDSALPMSSVPVRSASFSAAKTGHNWIEEDDGDTSWVSNFRQDVGTGAQDPPSGGEDALGDGAELNLAMSDDSEDAAASAQHADTERDTEYSPYDSARDSDDLQAQSAKEEDWLGAGPPQDQTSEVDLIQEYADEQAQSEQISEVSAPTQNGDDDDAPQPMPSVREVASSDTEAQPEQAAVPSDGAEAITNETPAEQSDPVVDTSEAKSPVSPTPSSTSSVESTTGMTQSEGLAQAEAYWGTPSLAKLRSQLKEAKKGEDRIDRLPEDPKDRIALLEVKVHGYRQQCRELESQLTRCKAKLDNAENEWESTADLCDEVREERDRVVEQRDRAQEQRDSVQERLDRLQEKRARMERQIDNGRRGYDQLTEEFEKKEQQLTAAELELEALRQENIALLRRLQQSDLGSSTLPDEGPADASEQASAPTKAPETTPEQKRKMTDVETQTDGQSSGDKDAQPTARTTSDMGGGDVEPLKADFVEDLLGDGTTTVSALIKILEHAGYLFRTDRFAQMIVDHQRHQGLTNVEALFIQRRFTEHDNVVRRLLEEIEQLELGLPDLADQLDKERTKYYELEKQLEHCREHGAALEEQNEEVQEMMEKLQMQLSESEGVVRELSEQQLAASDLGSDGGERIDPYDYDAVRYNLQRCCESRRVLQATYDKLEEQYKDGQAATVAATEKAESALDQLAAARTTIEALEVDNEQMPTVERMPTFTSERAVDMEATMTDRRIQQLSEEVDELKKQESKYVNMLQAARYTIVNLEERKRSSVSGSPEPLAGPGEDELTNSRPQTPAATPSIPTRSAQHIERGARARETEAYKRTAKALEKKHNEALQQREQLAELRRLAYEKVRGLEEIPYVAEQERFAALLRMTEMSL